MSAVGFIGTGHIAAPMARFLAARGHEVIVSERSADVAARLAEGGVIRIAPNQSVLDACETVFLCLRPQIAPDVLGGLAFRPDHAIVSVMAGVPRAQLEQICAPAANFTQTIPLGFLETGGCPLPAYPDAKVLADLFEPDNPVFPVASEQALNLHFAICALVPGVLEVLATGAKWLGTATGDPDSAAFYTQQLMAGFLSSLPKGRDGQLADERDALATEGTLSLQMVEALRKAGVSIAVSEALTGIGDRLEAHDDR